MTRHSSSKFRTVYDPEWAACRSNSHLCPCRFNTQRSFQICHQNGSDLAISSSIHTKDGVDPFSSHSRASWECNSSWFPTSQNLASQKYYRNRGRGALSYATCAFCGECFTHSIWLSISWQTESAYLCPSGKSGGIWECISIRAD